MSTPPPRRTPKADPPPVTFAPVGIMRHPMSSEPVTVGSCSACRALVAQDDYDEHAAAAHG